MTEMAGQQYIPARAWPRVKRTIASPAFGQDPADSTPVGDRRIGDPSPVRDPDPFPVLPVQVTAFSAGNRRRLPIVGVLREWWLFRTRMSGDIYVSNPSEHRRIVHRRMARVRRLDRLVASEQVGYEPLKYGPSGLPSGS